MSSMPTSYKSTTGAEPMNPLHPLARDLPGHARAASTPPAADSAPGRLLSLDAYRGLVMILMISAGLQIGNVVKRFDAKVGWEHLHTQVWDKLAFHTEHTEWTGCSFWDLIQPSFMFMVGTALAFSLANRRAKGQGFGWMLLHAVGRSVALVLLAVFLSTESRHLHTNWIFTNVLAQIGLGYTFLFLVAWLKPRWQFVAAAIILVGYFAAFAAYPKNAAKFTLASPNIHADNWYRVDGMPTEWEQAHFKKNANVASVFDRWFLNRFPRPDGKEFQGSTGGYQTLNFIPSLATMILGLLAGELLRGRLSGAKKVAILLGAGLLSLAAGWALGRFGICPVGKRIWTPSWAIFSAGWAFVALGLFYLVLDVWKFRRWEYPLIVVGANSIAIYCVSQMLKPFVRENMRRHFGQDIYEYPGHVYAWLRYHVFSHTSHGTDIFNLYGKFFAPMAEASVFLIFCWLLCWWAYRRKLFIKI